MKKIKKYEELTIKDDFMFGIIMRNPKYCKTFLETVLNVKISKIEYPESQKTIDISLSSKSIRLDIYVEDGKNTVYNIEMQSTLYKYIPKRSRYYQDMIDLNILEKGMDYRELKKSFVIFVCAFDLFNLGRHIYTFENRCIQQSKLPLGDGTTKIILNTKGTADDVSEDMKALLNYIDGQLPSNDYTNELDAAVKSARHNKKWRRDYMTLEMHYQEKYEQGIEKGSLLKAKQTATALLSNGKLSTAEIAECSGLSLKQVEALKEKLDRTNLK